MKSLIGKPSYVIVLQIFVVTASLLAFRILIGLGSIFIAIFFFNLIFLPLQLYKAESFINRKTITEKRLR